MPSVSSRCDICLVVLRIYSCAKIKTALVDHNGGDRVSFYCYLEVRISSFLYYHLHLSENCIRLLSAQPTSIQGLYLYTPSNHHTHLPKRLNRMPLQKEFTVTTTNKRRTKAQITQTNPQPQVPKTFDLDFSFVTSDLKKTKPGQHSLILRGPSLTSSDTPTISDARVLGVSDITFSSISKPIHLCFGDPDSTHPNDVTWESMSCGSKAMTNDYEFSIVLGGPLGRRNFSWKRTRGIDSMGVTNMVAMDWLNLKMVDVESKDVVARFVHYPWGGE